jgi:hypothetical protein
MAVTGSLGCETAGRTKTNDRDGVEVRSGGSWRHPRVTGSGSQLASGFALQALPFRRLASLAIIAPHSVRASAKAAAFRFSPFR